MDYELFNDLIGLPYKVDGRDSTGYDCYGLILEIGKRLDINFPTCLCSMDYHSRDAFANSVRDKFVLQEKPEFGLLVAIKTGKYITHVGFMLDHCRFIHALENIGVVVGRIDSIRYAKRIEGFYKWMN